MSVPLCIADSCSITVVENPDGTVTFSAALSAGLECVTGVGIRPVPGCGLQLDASNRLAVQVDSELVAGTDAGGSATTFANGVTYYPGFTTVTAAALANCDRVVGIRFTAPAVTVSGNAGPVTLSPMVGYAINATTPPVSGAGLQFGQGNWTIPAGGGSVPTWNATYLLRIPAGQAFWAGVAMAMVETGGGTYSASWFGGQVRAQRL